MLKPVDVFLELPPVAQAAVAGLFTWAITAAGAGLVLFTEAVNQKLIDAMLGLSGGVMIAASFWSLLGPAIEISENRGENSWLPAAIGFLLGGAGLLACDKLLPHLHLGFPMNETEGPKTQWRRSTLLVLAITLHNIPEGLAVGVAFGGVIAGQTSNGIAGALTLTLGIGLQNFPEGAGVAMPLRMEGMSRRKAFWYGQLSAAVEPIAAVVGAAAVTYSVAILPYALSFAAGAMIFVVVEELIPESHRAGNVDLATICLMVGFTVMMILDVALG
jgi:zinc transporter, ZIP family